METLLKNIQISYGYSNYEISLIEYVWKCFFSEFSKFTILVIFFAIIGKLPEFCIAMAALLPLRFCCGGFHCKHYWTCLLATFIFSILYVELPSIYCPDTITAIAILFFCLLAYYYYAPVLSIYKPEPDETQKKDCKLKAFVYILFVILLTYIIQMNNYVGIVFWTIVCQTIQLIIGYYNRKDEQTC